jgi:phosphatidylserine decarboxylase
METYSVGLFAGAAAALAGGYLYWRYVWFFRNPGRMPPPGEGILSPADGTVVYARKLKPGEDVVTIKKGVHARVTDILKDDFALPKLIIGVFMSPLDVHYNRAPLGGHIRFVRHYPASGRNLNMGPMHRRILFRRPPYYRNSLHLVQNERTVTRIDGWLRNRPLPCYVVQIAAKHVSGIDSYVGAGQKIERGAVFGMIRLGSQVDTIIPWQDDMLIRVQPGDHVRAGESVIVE